MLLSSIYVILTTRITSISHLSKRTGISRTGSIDKQIRSGRRTLTNVLTLRGLLNDALSQGSQNLSTDENHRPRGQLTRIVNDRLVINGRGTHRLRQIQPVNRSLPIGRSIVGTSHGGTKRTLRFIDRDTASSS